MKNSKILVADDDKDIVRSIEIYLSGEGYTVLPAYNGEEALDLATENDVELMILDVMMPKMNGIDTLLRLRERKNIPVIMLSAKSEDSDKIFGLTAGADDYVVKPFSPRELIARLRAVLRRGAAEAEKTIVCGPVALNESRFSAKVNGVDVRLGVIEFKMLCVLAANPGRVYSRAQLLERVWDDAAGFDERTVDVHVLRLRKQLAGTAAADIVDTVRGLGYRARA